MKTLDELCCIGKLIRSNDEWPRLVSRSAILLIYTINLLSIEPLW